MIIVVVIIIIIITGVGIVRVVYESEGGAIISYSSAPSTALLLPRIAIFCSALAPILFPSCPR